MVNFHFGLALSFISIFGSESRTFLFGFGLYWDIIPLTTLLAQFSLSIFSFGVFNVRITKNQWYGKPNITRSVFQCVNFAMGCENTEVLVHTGSELTLAPLPPDPPPKKKIRLWKRKHFSRAIRESPVTCTGCVARHTDSRLVNCRITHCGNSWNYPALRSLNPDSRIGAFDLYQV